MAKLDLIQTFVQVVRAGGFSAAARRTGMPRSTISLQVSSLEATLGTRLLKRSTRSIALTDEGRHLYDKTSGALETLEEAIADVSSLSGVLRGIIRLTAPADFPTEPLAHVVTTFKKTHPEVDFKITLTNATLDLVANNVDIALRMGGDTDMDTVQRRLLDVSWQFCASVAWIERHQAPKTIEDVSDFISPPPGLRTFLERKVLGRQPLPTASIEVDNHFMARDLILCGFGIGLVPTGLCANAIHSGDVKTLLDNVKCAPTRLTLTFPTRADMVPRVRVFADHFFKYFRGDGD